MFDNYFFVSKGGIYFIITFFSVWSQRPFLLRGSMYIFILKKNHILVSFKTVLELSIVKLSNCKCNTKPQHISDLKAKSGFFSAHDQKGALDELETPHCLL